VNVNISYNFQIFSVFGTGDMGHRKRKMTKTPSKKDFFSQGLPAPALC